MINPKKLALAIPLIVAAMLLPMPATAAPQAVTSYIYNRDNHNGVATGISIGVISIWDGRYVVPGKYDALLPSKQRTDTAPGLLWNRADGYYIGPGWCANVTFSQGGYWYWYQNVGAGIYQLSDITGESVDRWMLDPYRC